MLSGCHGVATREDQASVDQRAGRAHEPTIKEATVIRFPTEPPQIEAHLTDFINAHNYGRRLKTLKGLTYVSTESDSRADQFTLDSIH